LLPITLLVAGCVLVTIASWHLILFVLHFAQGRATNLWYPLIQTWYLGLAIYLIFTGLRKMHQENAVRRSARPSIGWGRILIGTLLIISGSYRLSHPTDNTFELFPSDENVKKWTEISTYAFMLAGAILVAVGVRVGFAGAQ
jgi:uncharacterized membrane protein